MTSLAATPSLWLLTAVHLVGISLRLNEHKDDDPAENDNILITKGLQNKNLKRKDNEYYQIKGTH